MEITKDFEKARLGDQRLTARLVQLAQDLVREPTASFPQASRTEAGTEATYRLLRNRRVTPEAILQPHSERTAERAHQQTDCVIVAHDTTEIRFPTDRAGLGRSGNEDLQRTFFLHAALALDGHTRAPLGVIGARRHVRSGRPTRKKTRHSERKPEPQRESKRWWELIVEADVRLADCGQRLHVCDREADQFLLLARCVAASIRFVIRGRHDRPVRLDCGKESNLRHALRYTRPVLCRSVVLAPRAPKLSWLGTSKTGRQANLEIRASSVVLVKPKRTPSSRFRPPETLALNVVHVSEINPPTGFDPVDWSLLTTESIETPEQVARIVDVYDARWGIEEYFKALKTGCAIERRQLESATTIFNAVAIFMPIAVQLLRLKHKALVSPDEPADTALSPTHVRILAVYPDARLPQNPTAKDVWLAVARMGGHLRQNGPPGWQVLWRGLLHLNHLVQGAQLAAVLTCDQS